MTDQELPSRESSLRLLLSVLVLLIITAAIVLALVVVPAALVSRRATTAVPFATATPDRQPEGEAHDPPRRRGGEVSFGFYNPASDGSVAFDNLGYPGGFSCRRAQGYCLFNRPGASVSLSTAPQSLIARLLPAWSPAELGVTLYRADNGAAVEVSLDGAPGERVDTLQDNANPIECPQGGRCVPPRSPTRSRREGRTT